MSLKREISLDALFSALNIKPAAGVKIIPARNLGAAGLEGETATVILHLDSIPAAAAVKDTLTEVLPGDYRITVLRAPGVPGEEKKVTIPLDDLDSLEWFDDLTAAYLPAWGPGSCRYPLDPLVAVMERLLGEKGCPWDREQNHLSLRQYLVEECYEVIEAIEENNMHKLCEELGDLLLQIVFHACLAQERKDFSLKDVVAGVTAKMIRRHPHVFGNVSVQDSGEVLVNWQQIKERERGGRQGESILAGIPKQLPALLRAKKLQAKAAQVGFDWDDVAGAWDKVEEELLELKEAGREGDPGAIEEEIGDLLFAIVNVARFLAVEPETALTRTNNKFIKRFRYIEAQARRAGRNLMEMTLAEMDNLWNKAKNNGKLCEKSQ